MYYRLIFLKITTPSAYRISLSYLATLFCSIRKDVAVKAVYYRLALTKTITVFSDPIIPSSIWLCRFSQNFSFSNKVLLNISRYFRYSILSHCNEVTLRALYYKQHTLTSIVSFSFNSFTLSSVYISTNSWSSLGQLLFRLYTSKLVTSFNLIHNENVAKAVCCRMIY